MRKLLALAADGMAGFLDLAMGALVAYLVGLWWLGVQVPIWYLPIGSLLAFLPDLDWFHMISKKGLLTATGDHRTTIFHRPLIMIPLCALLAAIVGGTYWCIVTTLCLLWHYNHDSRWVDSISDIDWLWPFGSRREFPFMDHALWRTLYWLQPSKLAIRDLGIGITIVCTFGYMYAGADLAIALGFVFVLGSISVWLSSLWLDLQKSV
jgi:hypothetical protein